MNIHLVLLILGYLAVFFKISFIVFSIFYRVSQKRKKMPKLLLWKERTDVLYITTMSIFLVYFFNPWNDNKRHMTKTIFSLLFLYGIVSIITANWGSFK